MERIPSTREHALRLGLVTLSKMLNALVISISNPCMDLWMLDVPANTAICAMTLFAIRSRCKVLHILSKKIS